jgi:putative IMPACT (imprinted ancient) family translation regulator
MDEDIYRTIGAPAEGYFKNKGSRFLSFAYPVENTEDIKLQLQFLKSHYHDDREPSGTAGKPILGQIHAKSLTNILVIVVRYFGGTLLGTSGLIEAYKSAAADVLSKTIILEKTENKIFKINFEFKTLNELLRIIRDEKAEIISKEFMASGSMIISIRLTKIKLFEEKLHNIKGVSIFESEE